MMRSNNTSGQSLIWLVCIVAVATLAACGDQLTAEEQETEEYRAALVSEQDISLSFPGGDSRSSGLNDEVSGVAALTAETVISTNVFLGGHLKMMRVITSFRPTTADGDRRVWEGTDDGYFVRVEVERSDAPRGTRFDYAMSARLAEDVSADMLTIFDGHVVRIETRPDHDNQGWGVVRHHFDNYNTLAPHEQVDGKARLAFRRVGDVRQVRVHLIGIETPEHPDFPEAAAYDYVLLPDRSGRMKWHARADFNQDGQQPLEDIAVHSYWRADLSGAGVARATDGSLDVEFVRSAQCWNQRVRKTYELLSWPGGQSEDGARADCVQDVDQLEPPQAPDEVSGDPEIPAAHPEES
jgi:hypothetical protein